MIFVLVLLAGTVALILGAELLIRGASRLAAAAGISSLVVGLTVVSFGTSAPELAVTVGSALTGRGDIGVGNVLGSNILNIFFILGLSAAVRPLVVSYELVRREVPILIGVTLAVWLLAANGVLGRVEGIVLVLGSLAYTTFLIREGRKTRSGRKSPEAKAAEAKAAAESTGTTGATGVTGTTDAKGAPETKEAKGARETKEANGVTGTNGAPSGDVEGAGEEHADEEPPPQGLPDGATPKGGLTVGATPKGGLTVGATSGESGEIRPVWNVFLVVAGLVLLLAGARWLVESAVAIATTLGVSEVIIGLTVVALGTSLPEVATSVLATLRGERDIAVGNVVGSNVFNLTLILGAGSAAASGGLTVPPAVLAFDMPIMVAATLACLPVFFTGYRIARWEGFLFLGYYVAYTLYLVLAASSHDALDEFSAVMAYFVVPLTVLTLVVLTGRAWRGGRNDRGRSVGGGEADIHRQE
ncbi:MAG: calcium/sodium antiporter [Gemmatimonadota bacterium]